MNSEPSISFLEKEIKIFLSKAQKEGLESGRKFYTTKLEPLVVKIKNTNQDYYNKNSEYFIEIYEMLYIHPNFSNPVRNLSESISIINEMFKKTG